jgi:D-amino-acid dehydrogenase
VGVGASVSASRNHRNTIACVNLALYSLRCLHELVAAEGIEYDAVARGILEFHLDAASFDHARVAAERMLVYGADRVPCLPARCIELEPALAPLADRLVGGIHTPVDESGDAHVFTVALTARAAARGVRFLWNTTIDALDVEGGRIARARATADGRARSLEADAYVVALGSYSPLLLAPLRVACPVYPVKGYSLTLDVGAARGAWTMSLTDPAHKLVFSRLGERLRVAGTAELDGWNTSLNDVRCKALLDRTFDLFPEAAQRASARYWTGLRPATPSNVPLIGRTRYPNLWLDTGHGTLGWTMACGSGHALAELLAGRSPAVRFRFLGVQP